MMDGIAEDKEGEEYPVIIDSASATTSVSCPFCVGKDLIDRFVMAATQQQSSDLAHSAAGVVPRGCRRDSITG